MILLNNIGFKNVRGKKLTTPGGLSIFIVNPTEGQEVTDADTLQSEVNASVMRIVFPTEGAEVTDTDTLQSEIE